MKVKVCGLNNPSSISELNKVGIDFMGFIFFNKSPRFISKDLILSNLSKQKVGVFVNENFETIINYTKKYNLAYVQLHGEEEPFLCKKLMKVVKVIKAFRVSNDYDINLTNSYIECCDYFLFDTKSDKFGGSGKKFDWGIIRKFTSKKFILSGGIDMSSIEDINKIKKENKCLVAVDINSKFEISPGTKDVQKIKIFLNKLNDGKL